MKEKSLRQGWSEGARVSGEKEERVCLKESSKGREAGAVWICRNGGRRREGTKAGSGGVEGSPSEAVWGVMFIKANTKGITVLSL